MTGFDDLRAYVTAPRVTGLRLSPDGGWLATTVQAASGQPAKYVSSIWRVDTRPGGPATRLTRSAEGEAVPEFLPDGSLLFLSKRPDSTPPPAADAGGTGKPDGDKPAIWLLPAGGGEARRVTAPGGGAAAIRAARDAARFAYSAAVLRGADGAEHDAERRKARADAGVSAILHEHGRLRYWDHDLGPEQLHLLTCELPAPDLPGPDEQASTAGEEPQDLTPEPGRALDEQEFCLTPDGLAVVTGWEVAEDAGATRTEIAVIDLASGARRVLLAEPGADFGSPAVSPDGRLVAAIRYEHDSFERPGAVTLVLTPLAGGGSTDLLAGFDRRPGEPVWAADSGTVYFAADHEGRCPVFAVTVGTGTVRRLTEDHGAYSFLCPAPDGGSLFALRSAIDAPPAPVRIDLADPAAGPALLASPGQSFELPGSLEEVTATAADGTGLRGWLVRPAAASAAAPAPLVLWVHGGPVMSFNAWSWRWNPWLLAARGYAVLMPDPALSTGYGEQMILRGHGEWGGNPYTDVLAITDAVAARPDIDAGATAMMGGSFGGYMANWIAGHTSRFRAIVSHAGLWALDQMFGTTDSPEYWRRIFGNPATEPGRYLANSPHLHADSIVTPMLIIHGDKDYRVPVGEALRMWWDLTSRSKAVRFLYFPDENHWIVGPGDVQVWYETVLAFLAEHVRGEQWQRPDLV